jgi:S-adenosylmethionine hydrolase
VAARTFGEVARGDIVLYEDSYRNISIAINVGDAASVISARAGDRVRIRVRA